MEPLGAGLARLWDLDEVLVQRETEYQSLLIARTAQGISLFCDDERQSTEASQLVYHEALLVPAMLLTGRVRRVLIVGSSEGVLSQMAVTAGAERVEHVDIDHTTVRTCATYLPYGYSEAELDAAEQAKGTVRMHYRDGWGFLAEARERGEQYDVIAIDLPDENFDPEAQHNRLYGKDFLQRCTELLASGGVLACQAGCPTLWRNDTLIAAWQRFHEVFGTVVYFGSDEHEWAFLAGRVDQLRTPVDDMIDKLPRTHYQPSSIDAEALRGNTVPPHAVRTTASSRSRSEY